MAGKKPSSGDKSNGKGGSKRTTPADKKPPKPEKKPANKFPKHLAGPMTANEGGVEDTVDEMLTRNGEYAGDIILRRYPGIENSPAAKTEVFKRMIFSLGLRGMKVHQISMIMGLSANQIVFYRNKIKADWENELSQYSILAHVGRSMQTYREFQGLAAQLAMDSKVKPTPRIMAINAGVNAEDRINELLKNISAFKNIRYVPNLTSSTTPKDDASVARAMAQAIMNGDEEALEAITSMDVEPMYDDNTQLKDGDITFLS